MNVIAFPDRLAIGARENLAAMVAKARSLQVFGPSVDFDASVWDLSHCFERKPGKAFSSAVLYFTARQEKPSRKIEGRTDLTDPFASFLKAMIVMRQFASPTSFGVHQRSLMVGRLLYEALAKCGHDIVDARPKDFMEAVAAIRKVYTGSSTYSCGEELERIGRFVDKHQLCKVPIRFVNPIERVDDNAYRVDDEAKEARAKKLPTDQSIAAVIEASIQVRNGGADPDLARMSVLEILLSAPWRINELLNLRADCERWDERPDGAVRFGIVYEGSKEAPDDVKWIPTKMKPIAERAVKDLLRLTETSREVARWMEAHPGRAWLPEPWRLRDQNTLVTATDVAETMGFSHRGAATLWMKTHGYAGRVLKHQMTFRQGDLEAAILSDVAKVMKDVPKGRLLSEYLFLFPANYFHRSRAIIPSVPTFLSQAQMRDFLVGDDAEKDESISAGSIFRRLKILDSKGQPFKLPSHGPRRYLNNLANEGLVSELDIARWSGRKEISQNSAYDYTGGAPLGRVIRGMVKSKSVQGRIAATVRKIRPADREDFLKARFATSHTTDIGMCVSDWSLAPCASHGACAAGCGDHMLVKGNPKHLQRAQQLLTEHEAMLEQARQAAAEGALGAGPWVEHNERMVAGLRKALAVHQDPAIADGTIVQPD
ncbi:hypothetical protein ABIG06_006549 [Bradyrhizobium sp. USDA 326]|uniref:hypothetical protein n=1 Tax=unclassified Bradyrhizobium TaxID=2631580 RepID=UPI003515AEDC